MLKKASECVPLMFRPLFRPFDWSGRSSRGEFWRFQVIVAVMGFAVSLLCQASARTRLDPILAVACLVGGFAYLTQLAVTVRRLHDSNLRGWWVLLPIVACTGVFVRGDFAWGSLAVRTCSILCGVVWSIFLVAFMLRRGTKGRNRFGPDPYDTKAFCDSEVVQSGSLVCGGIREVADGFIDVVTGLVCGSYLIFFMSFGFIIHVYTVYVAVLRSGFLAAVFSLIAPVLSWIYWWIRLSITDGFFNVFTYLILGLVVWSVVAILCLSIQIAHKRTL